MSTANAADKANRGRRIFRNIVLVGTGLFGLILSQRLCIPTAVIDGIWVQECPSGDLRQTVTLAYNDLQREKFGNVTMSVDAHYTVGPADIAQQTFVRLYRTDLMLVYPDGEKTMPLEVDRWNLYAGVQSGSLRLPRVPDGDYTLRAVVRSAIDEQVVDVDLPLYAPARIHVLTDRPLYEPGNDVLFRAVALRGSDMLPLPFRPGKWIVTDQRGNVLMEEAVQTDEWGVAAGRIPIDRLAESGTWHVRFESGNDQTTASFAVRPFTLPRFTVEPTPSAPFYTSGDQPIVNGQVSYSSGAPVSNADVEVSWQVLGDWPPPTEWQEQSLPKIARTDNSGGFSLTLPIIPADLQGNVTLQGTIRATDPAGDQVTASVSLLLSEDRIHAEAVTEMADGLVDGFNNRVFLRVTTPNGVPLPETDIVVRRAWDASDSGTAARTDADGVARLQLDPGPPVNVVIPPPPVRPPPRRKPVRLADARDLLQDREPTLADRLEMDRWLEPLEACANYVVGTEKPVTLGLSVAPSGRIESAYAGTTPLERCVAQTLSRQSLPPDTQRMMRVQYQLKDPDLPTFQISLEGSTGIPNGLRTSLSNAALSARACLPEDIENSDLPRSLLWFVREGSDRVSLQWSRETERTPLSAADVACVERALMQGGQLEDDAQTDAMGVARISVREASRIRLARPEPTVMLGYELAVSIPTEAAEPQAETLLRFRPTQLPALRIRATPVIAAAGEEVRFEFIRGQSFVGSWPETLTLTPQRGEDLTADFDSAERTVAFTLPEDAEGWFTLSWNGSTARIFVPDPDSLSLALSTEQQEYRPGEQVTINIQASDQASVGLFGVDQTLAQLAPLPGPDALADDLLLAPGATPPFPGLDAQALVMGRILGENAAEATLMRVNALPALPERDTPVSNRLEQWFDPSEDLIDSFYTVMAELHRQVRQWEAQTPEDEQMTNAIMVELWGDAVRACAERGEPHTDAFGRPLELHWLPSDLLSMVAPHEVVIDGSRLPEDVENWITWIAEEAH